MNACLQRASVAVAVVLVAALPGAAAAASAPVAPGTVATGELSSRAIAGPLHYSIFLPSDYGQGDKHYPVIYFLHGLPASPDAYKGIGALGGSLAKTGREAIVVGAQGAREGDTDPEWHDWARGRNWETATESELVRFIDAHYRTIPTRDGRAIVGISGGGYGAMLIGIHHPETYSVIEAWSGYFHATDPKGEKPLDLGGPLATEKGSAHFYAKNAKAYRRYLDSHDKPYKPLAVGFYIGTRDRLFLEENKLFDQELTAAGIPHVFRIYPGAHTHSFWAQHEDEWLAAAADELEKAR